MSTTRVTVADLKAGMVLLLSCWGIGCATHDEAPTRSAPEQGMILERSSEQPSTSRVVHLPGGIECHLDSREVLVPAFIAIDSGWIEQVACLRNSREHESIFVVECQPSLVHSALLLISLERGAPGRWLEKKNDDRYEIERIPPTGSPVRVRVRFTNEKGVMIESSVEDMIMGSPGGYEFPATPWVFCGSRFDRNGKYVADFSGSLVGFATFGDEVLGLPGVISDQLSVDAAVWEVRTENVPAPGTPVTLVLTPWDS